MTCSPDGLAKGAGVETRAIKNDSRVILTAGTARIRVIRAGISFCHCRVESTKGRINSVKSGDSIDSKALRAISHSVPGPFFLRYYPDHRLMAWQPQGTLDDLMLDQIAEWLVHIEKAFLPFKRFVDFSQLTIVTVSTDHILKVARRRAEQFTGVEPVRTALFSEDWVAFGIARLYESLMENTLIEARAFRDLAKAAEWLAIPVDVLTLKDKPVPHQVRKLQQNSNGKNVYKGRDKSSQGL